MRCGAIGVLDRGLVGGGVVARDVLSWDGARLHYGMFRAVAALMVMVELLLRCFQFGGTSFIEAINSTASWGRIAVIPPA